MIGTRLLTAYWTATAAQKQAPNISPVGVGLGITLRAHLFWWVWICRLHARVTASHGCSVWFAWLLLEDLCCSCSFLVMTGFAILIAPIICHSAPVKVDFWGKLSIQKRCIFAFLFPAGLSYVKSLKIDQRLEEYSLRQDGNIEKQVTLPKSRRLVLYVLQHLNNFCQQLQ